MSSGTNQSSSMQRHGLSFSKKAIRHYYHFLTTESGYNYLLFPNWCNIMLQKCDSTVHITELPSLFEKTCTDCFTRLKKEKEHAVVYSFSILAIRFMVFCIHNLEGIWNFMNSMAYIYIKAINEIFNVLFCPLLHSISSPLKALTYLKSISLKYVLMFVWNNIKIQIEHDNQKGDSTLKKRSIWLNKMQITSYLIFHDCLKVFALLTVLLNAFLFLFIVCLVWIDLLSLF